MYREKSECTSDLLRKKAKICARIWTILYAFLFPLFVQLALFSILVFDSPSLPTAKGLLIIFSFSLIPLSVPLSIDLMWASYVNEKYSRMRTLIFLPWLIILFVIVFNSLIEFLWHEQ